MSIFDTPPEGHADRAVAAEGRKAWREAAQHWTNARTTSQGHKRRERYDQNAARCLLNAKLDDDMAKLAKRVPPTGV